MSWSIASLDQLQVEFLVDRSMEDFILCKSALGNLVEIDIEDDGTVSLDTLKNQFGPRVATLTYINESTGRERLVRVSGNNLCPPKDGWKSNTREYTISSGHLDIEVLQASQPDIEHADFTPSRRALVSHPMIKREPSPKVNQAVSVKSGKLATIIPNKQSVLTHKC